MRSVRSSRSSRRELTPCQHCGRETGTSSDGVCLECWGRKRGGPQLLATKARPSRSTFWAELDDALSGFLWLDHGWWIGLALTVVGIVLVALLR